MMSDSIGRIEGTEGRNSCRVFSVDSFPAVNSKTERCVQGACENNL